MVSYMSIPAQEGHGLLIESLPGDWREARLLGRVQLPQGPTPVLIENGRVYDLSSAAPTVAQAGATVRVNGVTVGSGTASGAMSPVP